MLFNGPQLLILSELTYSSRGDANFCRVVLESVNCKVLFDTLRYLAPYGVALTKGGANGPGSRLNIKTVFPRYGDSHVKDKTVARPSYL